MYSGSVASTGTAAVALWRRVVVSELAGKSTLVLKAKELGLTPRARVVDQCLVGTDPVPVVWPRARGHPRGGAPPAVLRPGAIAAM